MSQPAIDFEKPVLAIGDVQGRLDRLEGLLIQEGVLGPCGMCGGSGDVSEAEEGPVEFCPQCKGSGSARVNNDVTVVQLGDLIDARPHTQTQDSLCCHFGEQWVDYFLWGNHDRPVIDHNNGILFGGYMKPLPEVIHTIRMLHAEERFRLAINAHGFLLVHAGLPITDDYDNLGYAPDSPKFGEYLDALDRRVLDQTYYRIRDVTYDLEMTPEIKSFIRLRDSIAPGRGGWAPYGGLLWRDIHEPLHAGVRQVFCHSSGEHVRTFGDPPSYCLDLSKHGALGAIWLPDERVVEYRP